MGLQGLDYEALFESRSINILFYVSFGLLPVLSTIFCMLCNVHAIHFPSVLFLDDFTTSLMSSGTR